MEYEKLLRNIKDSVVNIITKSNNNTLSEDDQTAKIDALVKELNKLYEDIDKKQNDIESIIYHKHNNSFLKENKIDYTFTNNELKYLKVYNEKENIAINQDLNDLKKKLDFIMKDKSK